MDLTNSQRKLYASLASAKGRRDTGLFLAQGTKCVADTIDFFEVHAIIATRVWIEAHPGICELYQPVVAKAADLQKISSLTTAPEVIAVYHIPQEGCPRLDGKLSLALDCVQDPGNLGTIMRVADWMGVTTILASPDTVDVWNPKVVQATMGAISRVKVHYTDLPEALAKVAAGMQVYGTFLGGENIYEARLSPTGVIVMGNEGKGISPAVEKCVSRRLTIPSFAHGSTSESLNVAVATAITLSEFRRRSL